MRITFVLPNLNLSGGSLVVAIYANGLAAKGHRVTVVATDYSRPTLRETLRSVVRARRLPQKAEVILGRFKDVDVRLTTAAEIASGAALPDADILVATWWETVEWITPSGLEKGKKFHLVQDLETFDYLPQVRTQAVLRQALPKIAVSRWLADEMKNTFGAKDVHLIENAVDIGQFNSPTRNKNSEPVFGFLNSSTPRKNVGLAIEALTIMRRQMGRVRAISFGADSIKATAWLEYHRSPAQELIPQLYARCDAWLFTSNSEGFGLPILEAMASRTPVIATPAGAAPQLVNDRNGQLIDFTVDSAVAAMRRISIMSNQEWKFLSDNARQQANKYNWDDAVDKMEKMFQGYAVLK